MVLNSRETGEKGSAFAANREDEGMSAWVEVDAAQGEMEDLALGW